MEVLTADYKENTAALAARLRVKENFDMVERRFTVGEDELCAFFIDGFIKDTAMQKMFQHFFSLPALPRGEGAARRFLTASVPYVEVELESDAEKLAFWVLSGAVVLLGSTFLGEAIVIDARTYPARLPEEPDSDRAMQGAKDGFVETLIFNTVLLRRRLRDTRLTMRHLTVRGSSGTDVVVAYLDGVADPATVSEVVAKLEAAHPSSLTMGYQSLAECLIPRRWYNPFPKIRTLERPDAAAAHLAEGSVLVLCDTSPQVMVLPTSIFDFMQETDDYYFPPLTGTYLRLLRQLVLLGALLFTPTWLLLLQSPADLPAWLSFLIPREPGGLPIVLQLFLAELAIDGLKLASMNTPDRLASSMSVVGGLILGDFAVKVGWLSGDVILYMALVAVAGFAQQNYELGYAIKFMRMLLLLLVALFGLWGYLFGLVAVLLLIVSNKTLTRGRGYLYPLIPFHGRALLRLFIRMPKDDRGKIKGKKEKTS
ncbi:MAG: spore germination protein [Clostridia bacterium]|nr:spore germination protein [Clostridia bacterium]